MQGSVTLVGDKRLVDERLIEIFNTHKHVGVAPGVSITGPQNRPD